MVQSEAIETKIKEGLAVVWFKRDLRIFDHQALVEAVGTKKRILPLYIFEPELWNQPDLSVRHLEFLRECLEDLKRQLQQLNLDLVVKVGNAVEVFEDLFKKEKNIKIFSHQETWNYWTYQRDLAVVRWSKEKCVVWNEYRQSGVFRRLKNRDEWIRKWREHLAQEKVLVKKQNIPMYSISSDSIPSNANLSLKPMQTDLQQKGGRKVGVDVLTSFLRTRGASYRGSISSPNTAEIACSRLSPYLAFGCFSMREVIQATDKRKSSLGMEVGPAKSQWTRSLNAFKERLRWHCHFIQKLEDEPEIEFRNLHAAYDKLRVSVGPEEQHKLLAWKEGRTGFPFIDACMRSLEKTGWINFRMRAMLVSFASFHLWLDWKEPALHLARYFLDYEPGIHYPQIQMQSATTGINAIRIYNPIKQSLEQDPKGIFIKKWIPELKDVPIEYIHTPWEAKELTLDYPAPIVNEAEARKEAADILYGLKKHIKNNETTKKIIVKHASRMNSDRNRKSRRLENKKRSPRKKISHHQGQGVLDLC